jgi:hypothetical protein
MFGSKVVMQIPTSPASRDAGDGVRSGGTTTRGGSSISHFSPEAVRAMRPGDSSRGRSTPAIGTTVQNPLRYDAAEGRSAGFACAR